MVSRGGALLTQPSPTWQALADCRIEVRSLAARLAFVVVAVSFTLLTRYIYVDVLSAARAFDYMGIRVVPASAGILALFTAIAVIPACWLPIHLRRPSDIIELFLYYAVHVPTAALLPLISYSTLERQIGFCVAITLAFAALELRYRVPALAVPQLRIPPHDFWIAIAAFYITSLAVFASSGYLSPSNFQLVEVYAQRLELTDRAAEIGRLFFYLANWTGAAFAPFLVVVSLYNKRWWLLLLAVLIATASFVASSNKANYIAVPAVMAGYYALRYSRGRYFGILMGVAFAALAGAAMLADDVAGVTINGIRIPVITYQVFHRTFSNNGFLSAIYLDLFGPGHFAYYADSFLRWVPGPRLAASVPALAGQSFTDVPNVHANAHLWADAYANAGYVGIAFTSALTGILLWVYDGITVRKDHVVATAALIVPATVLANTATHVALVSNGMFLVFLLLYAWPGTKPADMDNVRAGAAR